MKSDLVFTIIPKHINLSLKNKNEYIKEASAKAFNRRFFVKVATTSKKSDTFFKGGLVYPLKSPAFFLLKILYVPRPNKVKGVHKLLYDSRSAIQSLREKAIFSR